jgi:hypothetical protein
MPRKLTSATSLDNLKREAKRWLKALRENDVEARARMQRAYPAAPDRPVLRDVQHALACEYGEASWKHRRLRPSGSPAQSRFLRLRRRSERRHRDAAHRRDTAPAQAARAQESAATDDGFVELGRSQTLEGFWGRVCPNFGSRGFLALSKMPALRSLGVGCKNVDDRALAALPHFPALQELTPIGMNDDGFRHVGRCGRLHRLTCMYCRDTTDLATEHIAGLEELKYYYAGLTQITDRSLAILGRMSSLEQVEFYECKGVTDAGLRFLAGLPRLREVHLDGLPGVTHEGTRVFPEHVRVSYST